MITGKVLPSFRTAVYSLSPNFSPLSTLLTFSAALIAMGLVGTYKTKSRLFTDILRKTETLIKSLHYTGYVYVEGFINNNTFRAAKLHARLQFPIVNLFGELHPSWGAFLMKLATQKAEVVAVQPDRVAVGVTVLTQGYFEHDGQEPYKIYIAAGQTIDEAKAKAYKAIARANIPNGYYRIDIGDDFSRNLNELKDGEWL